MLSYQSHVPFQSILLLMRVCILGAESKNFIACPHIWTLQWDRNPEAYNAGDLFIAKDHANISASSPGIGPNIDEYGPRFYDISSMYEKKFTEILQETVTAQGVRHCVGDLFWVNNTAIPNVAHVNLAAGVSNDRVCFKGIVKNGVSELMAVHHRNPQSPYKLTSSMIGIVSDSVVRKQKKTDTYK